VTETFTFAHLSDLHLSSPSDVSLRALLGKRALGYLSWRLRRRSAAGAATWAAVARDLDALQPDQVLITGDLTQLGLAAEFAQVRGALEALGDPARVTVVPGNHDVYRPGSWAPMLAGWAPYLTPGPTDDPAGETRDLFPTLRVRRGAAIVGVSTAHPSAPFLAVGSVGADQRRRLADVLAETGRRGLFRVVLMHHPPTPAAVAWRKRLTDAPAFRAVVAEHGAELILHGHAHRTSLGAVPGPAGSVLVIGAPPATPIGTHAAARGRYHLGRVTTTPDGWRLRLELRTLVPGDRHAEIAEVHDIVVRRHASGGRHGSGDPPEEPEGEAEGRARRAERGERRADVKE
jgi:3',5'-cyclic AMP phosphodiesterase CpdA